MSFVWIQGTNKFNNSISGNVNVRNPSYSFNGLIVRKRAVICDRSTLFSKRVIKQLLLKNQLSLFTTRGGINGIFKPLTNIFKIDQ